MLTADAPFKAPPRISRDAFKQIIERDANPTVALERDPGQYWDVITATGVDPLFILAMFNHESTLGKFGMATKTFSWGNTRPPSFGVPQLGVLNDFSTYRDWLDGCKSTAARLVDPGWVYANRTRIRELFDWPPDQNKVWAPAGDNNDPQGYLRAVLDYMNAHSDQAGEPPVSTVPQPAWTVVPNISNKGGYAGTRRVLGIVNHIMDGTLQGTISWFQNPESKASSNFGIAKNGDLHLFVHPDEPAWGNGKINQPDANNSLVKAILASGLNANMLTVSKEFEGVKGDVFTDAQIETSNHLDAWLAQRYSITLTRNWVIGHYQIDSVNRPYCPGQSEDVWQRLMRGAQQILSGSGSTNPTPDETPSITLPQTQPDPWKSPLRPDTWIVSAFVKAIKDEGFPESGYVCSEAFAEDGKVVQYFERTRWEIQPNGAVTKGRVGIEAMLARYPDRKTP